MIKSITIPGLVIHGERDSLVFSGEGRLVFETLGSSQNTWLPIPNADHNDIMLINPQLYFQGIENPLPVLAANWKSIHRTVQ